MDFEGGAKLENMTMKELYKRAQKYNISGRSKWRTLEHKARLIAEIRKAYAIIGQRYVKKK
jgi:hypothetical protein